MTDFTSSTGARSPSQWLDSTSTNLVRQVRACDQDAWRRMVRLYSPLVAGWCRRAGLRDEDTADILQEVFRSVFAAVDRFHHTQPGDTFRGWLRVITRNKLNDFFRQAAKSPRAMGGTTHQQHCQQMVDPLTEDSDQTSAEDEAKLVLRQALEMVRGEFEAPTWGAFWRVVVDRLPADMVAAEMGLTRAAVYKAKSRVTQRLRRVLGEGE